MDSVLKKCPFCGGEGRIVHTTPTSGHSKWFISCNECNADTDFYKTDDEAIEAWNKRYEPDQKPNVLDYDRAEIIREFLEWVEEKGM